MGRPAEVDRPDGSRSVYLTFRREFDKASGFKELVVEPRKKPNQ